MSWNILEDFIQCSAEAWASLFLQSQHFYSNPRLLTWQIGPRVEITEASRVVRTWVWKSGSRNARASHPYLVARLEQEG
jgi:hypothetical protein